MASVFINDKTSVVLVESQRTSNMPYIVYFPTISTNGRLITVKDVDGFVSSGNSIFLSSISSGIFNEFNSPVIINQPYGFVTLATSGEGYYELVNSYALPQGPTNFISNIYTTTTRVNNTIEFIDVETNSTNILYTSSGQLVFNDNILGDVSVQDLQSTVANLGSIGYISSLGVANFPSVWVATGITSNQRTTTSNISIPQGSIQFSYNGSNFENASGGFTQYGTAVTYGNASFVAIGANCQTTSLTDRNTGFIQFSSNGINWTNSTGVFLGISSIRNAVNYGQNLFHAVGNNPYGGNNTILYSRNGLEWQPSGSVQYVAVGNNSGGNTIFSSTDGNTWFGRGNPFGTGSGVAVSFNSSIWVAVGGCRGSTIATSVDGVTWTPRGDPFVAPNTFQGGTAVQWNGSYWLATGYGSTNTVVASSNGITWSGRGSPLISGRGLGWNGSYWVLTGSNVFPNSQIFTSPDGCNWTGRGYYFNGLNRAALGVGWNGSYWAVGGDWDNPGNPKIRTSPDGITWTGRQVNFTSRTNSVTWNGSYWVATGGGDVHTTATSTDGITWTVGVNNVFNNSGTAAVWTGNRWIATGYFTNGLAESYNGSNWTVIPTSITSLFGVAYRSTLGLIPFQSAAEKTGYASGIAFGNGVWVCSGAQDLASASNSLIYSTDGINWNSSITVPFTGQIVSDVSFDGIKFMALCTGASAQSSNLVYSYNGSNWFNDGITGAGFENAGKYITGFFGTWVVYTSTTTDYIFYSSNEGSNWYQSTGLPANSVAYKPFYDGSNWYIGISTPTATASIYRSSNLTTWTNSGVTSAFTNGGTAFSFARSIGFSNATAYYEAYAASILSNLNPNIIATNGISTTTLNVGRLIVSSLFTNVTVATINNQDNETFSTINANIYTTDTFSAATAYISSLSSYSIENVFTADIENLIYEIGSFQNISTLRTTLQNLELNSSRVTLGAGNRTFTSDNLVAIGRNAGITNQETGTVAIGFGAGSNLQQAAGIAIGRFAGNNDQDVNAIAIGERAGETSQNSNSIILNASGTALNTTTQGFFVNPIRQTTNLNYELVGLGYNHQTSEVLSGYAATASTFSTIFASTLSVNFQNPSYNTNVRGLARFVSGSNIIQLGGSQGFNGPTITYNTIKSGNFNAEFISAKDSSVSQGGGFDFYTGVADNNVPVGSNLTLTILESTVGVNISSPRYNLDVLGILYASSNISTFAYFTSTVNGVPYPQTVFSLSNLTVRNQIFASSFNTLYLSVNKLTVTGPTVFGTGCNYSYPNNPDLQTSNLNFYASGQTVFDTTKNFIQITTSTIIFNSTLSVNLSTNRVGINMSTPLHSLDVRGNIFVTSTIFAPYAVLGNGTVLTSDSNIKNDIQSANLLTCYSNIRELPLRHFNYKSLHSENRNDKSLLGFIAQEVQPLFPKSVQNIYDYNTGTNLLHLSKDQIFMSHYGATQYLMSQIETNSTIMSGLYSRITSLNSQISTVVGGNV